MLRFYFTLVADGRLFVVLHTVVFGGLTFTLLTLVIVLCIAYMVLDIITLNLVILL